MTRYCVLLDSSVWVEYFSDGQHRKECERYLTKSSEIVVPCVVQYELYRKISSTISEDSALEVIAVTNQHRVVSLTTEVALLAGDLSLQYRLGMADSLILAHAQLARALLVTLDNDFASVPGTRVVR